MTRGIAACRILLSPSCKAPGFGPNFPSFSTFVFTEIPQSHDNSEVNLDILAQTLKVRRLVSLSVIYGVNAP